MLKPILLSVILAITSIFSYADPVLVRPGESLPEQCKPDGCIVLSQEDVALLEQQINEFAQRAYIAGAELGFQKGQEAKSCPRNINHAEAD